MEAAGGAAALRAAFDELLVFEQDFDTAMQILMFQDEKVARLSLEDAEHARSRRRATRNRGAARSPSRKRRRTGASQSARADPPSPPLSGFTQSSETWSLTASAEASLVVDASASDFLAAATSTQMSENGKIAQENEVEESVALSAATQPAGGDMSGAGGAGRGGSSTMVTSLFTTGSGRAVSVSKERLQAYETKLQAAEESVTLSAVRQLCDVDDNTRVGNVGAAGSEGVMDKEPWTASSLGDSPGESSGLLRAPLNEFASFNGGNGAAVSSVRSRLMTNPSSDIPSQHARGADKENVHPENVLVRQTAALEASKWQASLGSKQLNCRLTSQTRGQQRSRQQQARRPLKPSVGSRTSLSGTKRFRPPVASKKKLDNVASKGLGEPCVPTAPMNKKQKTRRSEGRPFIYEETMKISFSLLMALREDRELDQEMTGGGCDMSRFQVLDSITAENALDVRFTHDGRLVCSPQSSDDATIGPRELYRQLRAGNYILKSTGATFAWFLNHYRWIVWKLAATERSFPRLLMEKYLTKDQSLKQVMHRYERDLNNAQGSIVKKILQRDASSLSCMVLCVAAVLPFPAENNTAVDQELPPCWNMALVLTDGWYSVYAVPDAPLATVLWKLHSKSNLVGTKLATWNASLQNSTEGIDPLECAIVRESHWKNPLLAKEDLTQWPYLQLRYNSTRRVRFDTRLGVEKLHYVTPATSRHRKQQPQLTFSLLKSVPLKSLEVGGGMIRSVRVRVLRVSPVLHLQSKEWTLGPRIICEDQLPLYYQLRSEYARMAMQKNHKGDDGDMMMDEWSGGDNQIDVPPPIPFIKVDVECTHPCANENQGVGCGILTIWRPSEELLSGGLKEGVEYFASSLTVNWKLDGGRGQDASLRLSSTKHSGFEEIPEEDAMTDGVENGNTQVERSRRACVDVQQATTDYRTNFENGLDGRRNEKRPTIDVCVCVVLVTGRETQDESSVAAKRQAEVSLLDPALKPKESRYVEHVFVTDQSGHLMSIRVSGMEVTMPKTKAHSPLKRGSSSSFVFRRGNKNIWKEGAILCLSGLEVSHYDEQLRVLDCVLVESTQIVSFPSKKSPFWDNFHALQRELGVSTARGPPSQAPSSNFAGELTQLKKYVERDILRMDFVPSQEYTNEHHIEVVEQERLTQDLQAHVEGGETIANDQGETESTPPNRHLRWDGSVVKVLPLLGSSKVMFPRDVVAFACLNMKSDDKAFRTVYLTRELLKTMKSLLLEASTHAPEQLDEEKESQASETDFALVQSVTRVLAEIKQHTADSVLRFEVRQSTNERLINSWKPWERLHASNWMGVAVSTASTSK